MDTETNRIGHSDNFRSYAVKERRKIQTMTEALGITMELFKSDTSYLMTLGCCELFDCLLDGYESDFGKSIRKNNFLEVPEEFLIEVRALLFDALRDAGLPFDTIQKEIHFFEGRTGCPHRIISKKLSEPVIKAIESCWSTIQATKQEWNMTAEYLDLYYRTTIEPQVKKALTDEIPKFLEVMQYTNRITEQVLAKHKDKK